MGGFGAQSTYIQSPAIIHIDRPFGILVIVLVVEVDSSVVYQDVDSAVQLYIAGERSDALLVCDVESRVQHLTSVIVASTQSQVIAGTSGGEELQGCEVGFGQDQVAYGSADAAVLC